MKNMMLEFIEKQIEGLSLLCNWEYCQIDLSEDDFFKETIVIDYLGDRVVVSEYDEKGFSYSETYYGNELVGHKETYIDFDKLDLMNKFYLLKHYEAHRRKP